MRKHHSYLHVALIALSIVGLPVCGCSDDPEPATLAPRPAPEDVAKELTLRDIPVRTHRRVAGLLEEVRGTSLAPSWEFARIAPVVRPLVRPDIQGAAYHEFILLDEDDNQVGYIITSAGSHDAPIAGWGAGSRAPTQQLDDAASQQGLRLVRYYKLGEFSYVGETEDGKLAAQLGTLPPRIIGHDPSMLDTPSEVVTSEWRHDGTESEDDIASPPLDGHEESTGPASSPVDIEPWSSWDELKAGYPASNAVANESLAQETKEEWETDELLRVEGEGVAEGETVRVPLLYPDADVQFVGLGKDAVTIQRLPTGPETEALDITATTSKPGVALSLEVQITYGNGISDSVKLAILSPADVQPPDSDEEDSSESGAFWTDPGPPGTEIKALDGPPDELHWTVPDYWQIPPNISPNTRDCDSGCGATAWAMLFGWVDRMAALGPTINGVDNPWAGRNGIYRLNGGGKEAPDDVAPLRMCKSLLSCSDWDLHPGVSNMTWEIQKHIGTYCNATGGATTFWGMNNAMAYLKGRTWATLRTKWTIPYFFEGRIRRAAKESIVKRRTPVIIARDNHYPLATGYRETAKKVKFLFWTIKTARREFYVNQGWYGALRNVSGWVPGRIWLAGLIFPSPSAAGSCEMPHTLCGGQCVDTKNSIAHCGACGNVCPDGQTCVNGSCAGSGNICTIFAGFTSTNIPSRWSFAGELGWAAGTAMCQQMGALDVCDYTQLKELFTNPGGHPADMQKMAQQVPLGGTLTAWVKRTTIENVNGTFSGPSYGGNCNGWTYEMNDVADGEYVTITNMGGNVSGVFTLDPDTAFSGDPLDGHAGPGLDCGGMQRRIPCCYGCMTP